MVFTSPHDSGVLAKQKSSYVYKHLEELVASHPSYLGVQHQGASVMSPHVRELFRQASERDEQDRAVLAGLLLESLEHAVDEPVESAWQEEIARRLTELDTERVELVPWDAVQATLMRHTGAPRPDQISPCSRSRFCGGSQHLRGTRARGP
jgi:putative addiction module component (TIGR02574 family)